MPPKEEEDLAEQGEVQENVEVGAEVASDDMKPQTQEPTFFSDERGNLKAVNMVCRHPCKIFWFLMVFCFIISFLLQALVISTAEDGNPFTTPENGQLFLYRVGFAAIIIIIIIYPLHLTLTFSFTFTYTNRV